MLLSSTITNYGVMCSSSPAPLWKLASSADDILLTARYIVLFFFLCYDILCLVIVPDASPISSSQFVSFWHKIVPQVLGLCHCILLIGVIVNGAAGQSAVWLAALLVTQTVT